VRETKSLLKRFSIYIYRMQASHEILKLIYEIVKEDSQPLTYQLKPRELILRSMQDWSSIHTHLNFLEKEELIVTKQLDTMIITITQKGWEAAKEWEQSNAVKVNDVN